MPIADDVVALIDKDELVRFALELCNIDSAVGHEGEVAEHVFKWLQREGFTARKIGLLAARFNVLGTLPGTGGGYSLIFNSHFDTAVPREPDLVHSDPTNPVYHSAWLEGDLLLGEGICNDKGPMAAFLLAAQAIKRSGHQLIAPVQRRRVPMNRADEGVLAAAHHRQSQGPLMVTHDSSLAKAASNTTSEAGKSSLRV